MSYSITKRFTFEAAHILEESASVECQRIHGHSYKVEVTIYDALLEKCGMVLDFKILSSVVKPILEKWDHMLLVKGEQPPEQKPGGVVFVDWNPTAENMARYLWGEIVYGLHERVKDGVNGKVRVRVYETETAWVEYE